MMSVDERVQILEDLVAELQGAQNETTDKLVEMEEQLTNACRQIDVLHRENVEHHRARDTIDDLEAKLERSEQKIAALEAKLARVEHAFHSPWNGYKCDGCATPGDKISGARYHCMVCPDKDYCISCRIAPIGSPLGKPCLGHAMLEIASQTDRGVPVNARRHYPIGMQRPPSPPEPVMRAMGGPISLEGRHYFDGYQSNNRTTQYKQPGGPVAALARSTPVATSGVHGSASMAGGPYPVGPATTSAQGTRVSFGSKSLPCDIAFPPVGGSPASTGPATIGPLYSSSIVTPASPQPAVWMDTTSDSNAVRTDPTSAMSRSVAPNFTGGSTEA